MKWNEKRDEFTLTRKELNTLVDYLDGINLMPKKEQPPGWKKDGRKMWLEAGRVLCLYAKTAKFKKYLKKNNYM